MLNSLAKLKARESKEMGECERGGGGDFWRGEDEEEKERRRKGGWGNTEGSSCLFKAGCSDAQSHPADQLAYLNPCAARGSRASTLLGGTSERGGFWMRTQESRKRSVFPTVWTATKMTWSSNSKLKGKRKSFTFSSFLRGYREGGQTDLFVVFFCTWCLIIHCDVSPALQNSLGWGIQEQTDSHQRVKLAVWLISTVLIVYKLTGFLIIMNVREWECTKVQVWWTLNFYRKWALRKIKTSQIDLLTQYKTNLHTFINDYINNKDNIY